nr:ubiquinol-cytochrome c reductase iron-sulfur subunit [Longirhabdus pacifica]
MSGEHNEQPKKSVFRKEMSRRQFLSYTLGGSGAFMVGVPLLYNVRFAVDPLLKPDADGEYVKVVEVSEVTQEPQSFQFERLIVDGWYKNDTTFEAWISKDESGNIFALSPVCKHLGCTVKWNGSQDFSDEYFCPCHAARYTKDGKNLTVAPAPLDEYPVKIEDGWVYLSTTKPNSRV